MGEPVARQHLYTFSPAVRSGNLLFASGTTATDEHQEIVDRGDIAAQTRQIFRKFEAILTAAGGLLRDIVEISAIAVLPAEAREAGRS